MIGGPFWTVPNALTLLRVPLAVGAVWCEAVGLRPAAIGLLTTAFLSDGIDGFVARATRSTSEWGRVLDPLADKVVFIVLGVALVVLHRIPGWFLATLVARDLAVILGSILHIRRHKNVPSANILGKLSTTILAVYMLRQLFWPTSASMVAGLDPLGVMALVALCTSSIVYALAFLRHDSRSPSRDGTGHPVATG